MLYEQAMPDADKLQLTKINHSFENADTYLPDIDDEKWEEVKREDFNPDEKNKFNYSFIELKRK